MQCLNIKNKEVAALLDEYTRILGNEDAAYYVLSENDGYGLDKAPNGEPSKLYSDLLSHYDGDHNMAIKAKSQVYTDSFKNWFGNWLSDDKTDVSKVIDFNDSVDFLFEVNPELSKVGTKSEYEQYVKTIFPNSILNSIYWHGTDSDFSDGLNTAKRGKGSGAPETQNEMYFNRQPWASLQYISGINRKIKDNEGFNNWVKLWWELKEALGNGRMDTDDWKNEIIGPNTRQSSPNKRGIFDRDKGGTHGKYLSERKARYGYENKSDKEFFEEVFDIRYGKETFNDWINRKRDEFKSLWNNRSVKNGIIPAVLNVRNPIVEEGQNTYYEEQRGLFTQAKQNGNDAILSNKSKNEFGSDVAIVFNPNENVHFLGTKSDIENFKKWKSNNQVSKVVDENGEPKVMFRTDHKEKVIMGRNDEEPFFATDSLLVAATYASEDSDLYTGFVNLKNPYIVDEESHGFSLTYDRKQTDIFKIYKTLAKNGYDGVLYKRVWDVGDNVDYDPEISYWASNVAMFDPNQIKSVDNQGTFSTQDDNIYRNTQNTDDPYTIQNRIFNLEKAYNDISSYKDLHSFAFDFKSDAWDYIRSKGWTDVSYVYSDRGRFRIGRKSKKSIEQARNLLQEALNDSYYRNLSEDEILSNQMLEEQEAYAMPNNADYEAYLQSDESVELPIWETPNKIFQSDATAIEENAQGSDKDMVNRIFKGKSIITAAEALAEIKKNPAVSRLAEQLELLLGDSLSNTKIAYLPYGAKETGAAAQYYHSDGNIVVFGDAFFKGKGGLVDTTILHELVHAATINKLKSNPEAYESAQRILDSARRQLAEKYGMSWEELVNRYPNFYGLTNVYEFFSEVYSNSAFIYELSSLEAEGEVKPLNFLQGIVKWLLNLFKPNRINTTLYEQAAAELESVMFNLPNPMDMVDYEAYKGALDTDESIIFASNQRTNDPIKIKNLLHENSKRISFAEDSHTYTNVETGEIYTPVTVVKDLHGYGADTSVMSDEDLAYGQFAAKVGTAIHNELHYLLTGEKSPKSEVTLSPDAKKMIKDVVLPRILKKDEEIIASEQIVANDEAKVAGTVDFIKKDKDGNIHLLDFKTKARTVGGKAKYGFDYYFSSKRETKKGGKPDSDRHEYQLTMYKRMLELAGVRIDSKEIVPLEYTVTEDGVVTEVWIPPLDYAQEDGTIYHRTNNALEKEINDTVLTNDPTESPVNAENLLRQSEIVENILKTLKNQLAIYRVRGNTTKAEVLRKFIDSLNSKEEDEIIVEYINTALKLLTPLIDTYNANLEAERSGQSSVWNLRTLEAWKNYAESFYNLDDIQDYLFVNPQALSSLSKDSAQSIRQALATAISYKNALENAYKNKGEAQWLEWLTPFTTRVEAEYREEAEKQYKKENKGTDKINDVVAMNKYINDYIAAHRNEINTKSRELLRQQSRISTTSPLNAVSRWMDTIFESADPIVGAMARAYHTQWTEANMEFNALYRQLVDLTRELEEAYPTFKNNPAKLYDFMIEQDEAGSRLISHLPSTFIEAYDKAKRDINSNPNYETSKDKAVAIATWLNENAPIKGKVALDKKKLSVIDRLLSEGKIDSKQHKLLVKNEKRDYHLKRSWADLVARGLIGESVADELRVEFNKLNWEHRVPNEDKYPNKKWNALQKVRESNPKDIRVRFFDFIQTLALTGDSYVPDRFKLHGRLPGMSKMLSERLTSTGVTQNIIEGFKKEFTIRADDTDRGLQMTDELDRPIKFVPIYFTNTLDNNEQSLDIATIYKEWFRSVNNYKYINDILPQLEYTKHVIETRKTIQTDDFGNPIKNVLSKIMHNGDSDIDPTTNALITDENLIAQVNIWFDQVVYGISTRDLGSYRGIDYAKLLEIFSKYTSLKVMALNTVSMVNNALMAEVQQAEEAFAGQYVSAKSYSDASVEYFRDMPNILADVGSRKITSLTNLLNEHFGVFVEFNAGSMLDNTKAKKLSKVSTMYFTTNLGEHEAQSRFLIACLKEKRALDKDGNDIGSMYDYFSVENGELVFDKEHKVANFSKEEQIAFGQQVTAILRKMHGNYAPYSKVALQQYGFGRLALMFRKWIFTSFKRRMGGKYYDEYGQTFSKGFYRDGGAFYYNKVRSFFERFHDEAKALELAEKADWDTMTEAEKANVKRFTTEMSVLIGSIVLQSVVGAALDGADDDDDISTLALMHIDYQLYRLSTDISFYFNPASFMKIVQSPIPSSSVIRSISNFLESCLHPLEKFETGDWKGEYKIKKRALDLLPIVRQIYRLRNIEDEKQLLSII